MTNALTALQECTSWDQKPKGDTWILFQIFSIIWTLDCHVFNLGLFQFNKSYKDIACSYLQMKKKIILVENFSVKYKKVQYLEFDFR